MEEFTMEVPIALQQLILNNNKLLKDYQAMLWRQVEDSNKQMMGILKLDPAAGWRLDMERMVYVQIPAQDTPVEE
jgi:hypothetical protein